MVFDTSSLSELNAYYPDIFKQFWSRFDEVVSSGHALSTQEVHREISRSGLEHIVAWAEKHEKIFFTTPTPQETDFVKEIFTNPHFCSLIGAKQRQRGGPVADPFVIACAKIKGGTVVTEEKYKPNAAKIPNVCAKFGIPCLPLVEFMRAQQWSF